MVAKKVLLVGSFGVGKTSLIRRFVMNEFSEDYVSTIGVRVSSKVLATDYDDIKLMVWDVAGTSDDEKVPKSYFLGANAAMYVFDLSREETYVDLVNQIETIKQLSGLDSVIVVGNKKDLLTEDELWEVKKSITTPMDFITSAKENANVEDAFLLLTRQSLKE